MNIPVGSVQITYEFKGKNRISTYGDSLNLNYYLDMLKKMGAKNIKILVIR